MTASSIVLEARDGARYQVATGALWLDFVYTGGEGARAHWETLHAPGDLERWARASRLAVDGRAPRVAVTADELAAARALREVLWRAANLLADGRRLSAADREALNAAAASPDIAPRLTTNGAAWAVDVTGTQLASALARDVIATIRDGCAERVKRCAADDCALVFIDTSRPGARRWCAMERCGNRTKVRRHREHQSSEGDA